MQVEMTDGDRGARVTLDVVQDIGNNTSTITVSGLELNCNGYNGVWVTGYVRINYGSPVLDMQLGNTTGNACNIGPSYSPVYLNNFVRTAETVAHEADGTKSITVSVHLSLYIRGGSGDVWNIIVAAGVLALPTIPRASSITLSPNPVEMGKRLAINIHRASASFTHRLYYTFGVQSNVLIAADAGGSFAWTVPDLAAQIPGALSGACTITCDTYSGGAMIGRTTAAVTLTVPGARAPEGYPQLTCGTAGTITYRRSSAAYTLRVEYRFNGASGLISEGMQDSFSWIPPYDLAKRIPALTVGTGTFTYTLLNGTAVVGAFDQVFRLTVPENDVTRPVFPESGLTLTKLTGLTGELAQIWIRGKTGIQAIMSAQSAYSQIAGYSFTVGSARAEGNPAVIDLLADDGEVAYTARVTDARGFSRSVTGTIYVYPYRAPKIVPYSSQSAIVCERAKSTGDLSSEGTYLAVRAGKNYSSLVKDGTDLNSCVLRYRYKASIADAYGAWATLLASDSQTSFISTLIGGVVTSTQNSYDVELGVLDSLGSEHSMVFRIMTGAISFVLYDGVDGAGFGKYPEQPHVVDIAAHMTLHVRGNMILEEAGWQELGLADGVLDAAQAVGRYTGCGYRVHIGRHVYAAFSCSFRYTGVPITINAAPMPEEIRPAAPVWGISPINDGGIAAVCLKPDGYIQVQWVLRNGQAGQQEVLWIDGYLDYWI